MINQLYNFKNITPYSIRNENLQLCTVYKNKTDENGCLKLKNINPNSIVKIYTDKIFSDNINISNCLIIDRETALPYDILEIRKKQVSRIDYMSVYKDRFIENYLNLFLSFKVDKKEYVYHSVYGMQEYNNNLVIDSQYINLLHSNIITKDIMEQIFTDDLIIKLNSNNNYKLENDLTLIVGYTQKNNLIFDITDECIIIKENDICKIQSKYKNSILNIKLFN